MKIKNLSVISLALLAGILLLAACGAGPEALSVGGEANDTRVELQPGQELVITLESNPTTGYGWHVAQVDAAILGQVGETEFVQAEGSQGLVGAGGSEVLRFEALASGTTTLVLSYDRLWESEAPLQTFTLTVVVP